ncbi:hypothetical protein CR513_52112, partial [Mucuna pruriens]
MLSIFSNLLEDCMEVFMDDFTVKSGLSTEAVHRNQPAVELWKMPLHGNIGDYARPPGIKSRDRAKIDIVTSLPNHAFVREVRSFLEHASFYKHFIKNFRKTTLPLSKLLQKMWSLSSTKNEYKPLKS